MYSNEDLLARCNITPRDERKVAMIRDAWSQAKKFLDGDGNFTDEFYKVNFVNE